METPSLPPLYLYHRHVAPVFATAQATFLSPIIIMVSGSVSRATFFFPFDWVWFVCGEVWFMRVIWSSVFMVAK